MDYASKGLNNMHKQNLIHYLMKKCWNEDPLKRPSAGEVLNIILKWIFLPDRAKVKDIDKELKCNVMEFINAPIIQIIRY
ncbi:kinase-like domain-containing protein [Rhizophagus irregularis DAOM 181602=DAOM 197198]|nr:kinase-like domain-containing protein [Rhizophagus irregularis DAOM 181602=DAOM 197198]